MDNIAASNMSNVQQVLLCCCIATILVHCKIVTGDEEPKPPPLPYPPLLQTRALYKLRSDLGIRSHYWPRNLNPCTEWMGIQCDTDGQVIAIVLSGLRRTARQALHPSFSLDALQWLRSLHTLNTRGFPLPGQLPDWLGHHLLQLRVVDASSSHLEGSIPNSLGALSHLQVLSLAHNNLTGTIPPVLSALSELNILDLSSNHLSGPIPAAFIHLRSLTMVNLSNNRLQGPIPAPTTLLKFLEVMDLSNNKLNGYIPAEFGNISTLIILDLSFNAFTGSVASELGNLKLLKSLKLCHNFLSGKLPFTLGSLWRLTEMDLSFNNLTGALPSMALPEIKRLSLSHNSFYGLLPAGIKFNGRASLDLSYNYFRGNMSGRLGIKKNCFSYTVDQRPVDVCKHFYFGRGLEYSREDIASLTLKDKRGINIDKITSLGALLGGMVGGVSLILLMIGLAFTLNKQIIKGKSWDTGDAKDLGPFTFGAMDSIQLGEKFTYAQLRRATKNFDPSYLIKVGHSGELYRGILSGVSVVVKRIVLSGSLSSKSDIVARELEVFGKVSHKRLIPLLGHCLELDEEKFLVYKYMHNGDLSHALQKKASLKNHHDGAVQSLDWITRLKVAIGAAEGLAYLHHECVPHIAHGDVQASSILLDDQFEARLGSLSDVSLLEGESHHGMMGCFRHMSQSSNAHLLTGDTIPTCSYDVYCFGKLLLELITGRIGSGNINGQEFGEAWLDWTLSQISIYNKEAIIKVVDSSLILDEDLLEEVWAMSIVAKSCLHLKPSRRPLMRYVLKALENPLKVGRYGNALNGTSLYSRTSSYGSWNMAFFGSWRHSIDSTQGPIIQEEIYVNSSYQHRSVLKQTGNQSSPNTSIIPGEMSKRRHGSNEVFPEPVVVNQSFTIETNSAAH